MKRRPPAARKRAPKATRPHRSLGERSFQPEELPACERDYKQGDKLALAHAIAICACADIALPEWAARAYLGGYTAYTDYLRGIKLGAGEFPVKSWDDVLGRPLSKGSHVAALRKRSRLAFYVWAEVQSRRGDGSPIDATMFEGIGKELGVSKTVAQEYYADQRERLERADPGTVAALARETVKALKQSKGAGSAAERNKACVILWQIKAILATLPNAPGA